MTELRELLEAATPGPWWTEHNSIETDTDTVIEATNGHAQYCYGCYQMEAKPEDMDLIVHLRNNADKYAGMEERIAELESQLEASQGALREQMKARRDACAKLEAVEERYFDLIMCVSRKFPGELRHDTAKRYITESETATCDGQAKAALQGDGGQE